MALDPGTVANVVGSEVSGTERWLKLYRKIHDLFLRRDFVNKSDHELTVKQLNLRIDQLELLLAAELTKIQIHGQTHVHPSAPVGPPTPTVLPLIVTPPKTTPIQPGTQFVEQRNTTLQATGEPVVPMTPIT